MKTQIVLFTAGAIALMGCGSQYSKLSSEQEAKFNDTLAATGRIERASSSANPSATPASRSAAANVSGDDDVQVKMSQRLSQNNCTIDVQAPAAGDTNFTAKFRVDGQKCPVAMDYRLSQNVDFLAGKLSFDVDESYRVVDTEYAKLNDVDSLTAKGGIKVERDDDKLVLSGTVTGTIHSQKNGTISFKRVDSGEMRKDGSGDAVDTLTFTFPEFTAELKTVQDSKTLKYYINDEEISSDQYQAYLKKAGMMFQLSPVTSQASR